MAEKQTISAAPRRRPHRHKMAMWVVCPKPEYTIKRKYIMREGNSFRTQQLDNADLDLPVWPLALPCWHPREGGRFQVPVV